MKYNREFEHIDSPEKAYVLGLFYSDGYISYTEGKSYYAGIGLHEKDESLLDTIMCYFPFFIKYKRKERKEIMLRCNQKQFVKDLISNGVLLNKSGINKYKVRFPKIKHDLLSHFIRGVFDGDGSIIQNKDNPNTKAFTIVGNNYFLIKRIMLIILSMNIKIRFEIKEPYEIVIGNKLAKFKSKTFSIVKNGNVVELKKLSNYLYDKATIFAERKKFIFNNWIKKEDTSTITCPRCGKLARKDKNRIRCLKCKRFSSYNKIYFSTFEKPFCKKCKSITVLQNGTTRSKIDKSLVSVKFLCRKCNCNSSFKIKNCTSVAAPLCSNT